MSYTRPFHWTCDKCRKLEIKDGWGLPRNWTYVPATLKNSKAENHCDDCSKKDAP